MEDNVLAQKKGDIEKDETLLPPIDCNLARLVGNIYYKFFLSVYKIKAMVEKFKKPGNCYVLTGKKYNHKIWTCQLSDHHVSKNVRITKVQTYLLKSTIGLLSATNNFLNIRNDKKSVFVTWKMTLKI